MMNPIDQIAAEAAEAWEQAGRPALAPFIKSVIEKAKLVGWKEGREHLRESLKHPVSRAAHASEHKYDEDGVCEVCGQELECRPAEVRTVAAHASEQGAKWKVLDKNILYHGDTYVALTTNPRCADLIADYCNSLSQRPTPATAASFENDATIAHQKATTPATASETNRVELRGKHIDIEYFGKPDSASTGKHSMGEGANRSQRLRAHIPEYAGEWTVLKTYEDDAGQHALLCPLNIEGLYGALKPIAAAHNAALRENNEKWRKEVKQFIERQHSLRDYGNDTKRLDLMETQGGQFAKIKGKSWRESADIHAAMSQKKVRGQPPVTRPQPFIRSLTKEKE